MENWQLLIILLYGIGFYYFVDEYNIQKYKMNPIIAMVICVWFFILSPFMILMRIASKLRPIILILFICTSCIVSNRDNYEVDFLESSYTQRGYSKEKIDSLIKFPPEDMKIYKNGKLIKHVKE